MPVFYNLYRPSPFFKRISAKKLKKVCFVTASVRRREEEACRRLDSGGPRLLSVLNRIPELPDSGPYFSVYASVVQLAFMTLPSLSSSASVTAEEMAEAFSANWPRLRSFESASSSEVSGMERSGIASAF